MSITDQFPSYQGNPKLLSPQALAFVGDCVFELLVRSHLIQQGNLPTRTLHRRTVELVHAPAQALAYNLLIGQLTAEESDILRRGRNAKTPRVPRNASVEEYHKATALEALFGYLYLSGNLTRVVALFTLILESLPAEL